MRDRPGDGALVAAWRRGDPEAVRSVVALHGATLLRVALALCPRAEDAEEVVQDALLRAHRSLATFDAARGSLRAWLIGVTANRARQVRRGLARYARFLERFGRDPYAAPATSPSPDGDLDLARRRLASLTRREREAFLLVDVEDLSSVEAGRILGISASTVRVLVNRARARLQRGATLPESVVVRAEGSGR